MPIPTKIGKKSQAAMEQLFAKKPGKMHFRWISQCSIHHNTKSQAAMEFLMTYGWALLIILLVIAALAYFGMLNPDRFLPDKVTVSDNRLQVISTSSNRIILKNAGADTLMNLQVNMTNHNCIQSQPATIAPGEVKSFVLLCDDVPTPGNRLKGDIKINYTSITYGDVMTKTANAFYAVRGNYFSKKGLVGYWPLDDLNDYSGNGNNVVLNSNSATPVAGKINGAYNFDGTQYLRIDHSTSLALSSGLTANAWFMWRTAPAGDTPLLSKTESSMFSLYFKSGTASTAFVHLNGAYVTPNFDYTQISQNQWHMLTSTYDGAAVKIYLDGNLKSSAAGSGAITSNTLCLLIGAEPDGTCTPTGGFSMFDGRIDEVMIFNRGLSADEVKALYEAGR
jgi:hypothetical protein